jgi:hypothetical protein
MPLPQKLDDLGLITGINAHSLQLMLPNGLNLTLPWSKQHHRHHGNQNSPVLT